MITINRGETTILKGAEKEATDSLKRALNFAQQRILQFSNKKELQSEEDINHYAQIKNEVVNLVKNNDYDNFLYGLNLLLDNHKKQIEYLNGQLSSASLEEQKIIKKSIQECNNKIADTENYIREVEKAKKEYDQEEKEAKIKKHEKMIQTYKNELIEYQNSIKKGLKQLDEALESPEETLPIISLSKFLKNVIKIYKTVLRQINRTITSLKQLSDEKYSLDINTELEDMSKIVERYIKARVIIDEVELKIASMISKEENLDISKYTQIIAGLQNVLTLTSSLINDKETFARVQNMISKELNEKHHQINIENFREELTNKLENYYTDLIDNIRLLKPSIKARDSVKDIFEKYTMLNKEEKNKIFEEVNNEVYENICINNDNDLSEEEKIKQRNLYDYLINYVIRNFSLNTQLNALDNLTYNSSQFNEEYTKLLNYIINIVHTLNNREEAESLGIKADFDEETQTLLINLSDKKLGIYKKQIVSDEVLNMMRNDKKYIVSYPKDSWLNINRDKIEIQIRYKEIIEEINHLIRELNDYLHNISSSSKSPIETDREVLKYPSLNTTTYCERIIELRAEMIDISLKYLEKYRIPIQNEESLKDLNLRTLEFVSSNKDFVLYHNKKINDLIRQIDALTQDKSNTENFNAQRVQLVQKINIENSLLTNRLALIGMQNELKLDDLLSAFNDSKKVNEYTKSVSTDSKEIKEIKELIKSRISQISSEEVLTYDYEKNIIKLINDIKNNYLKQISSTATINYDLFKNVITISDNGEIIMAEPLLNNKLFQLFLDKGKKISLSTLKQAKIAILRTSVKDFNNEIGPRTIREILEENSDIKNSEIDTILEALVEEGLISSKEARTNQTIMPYHKFDEQVLGENVDVKLRPRELNLNGKQNINTIDSLIIKDAKALTISLIKNGLKIKLSQSLADKLSSLKAKISLVNKNNYRDRTSSSEINNVELEHEISFANGNRDILNDYKMEIRKPKDKGNGTEVIFEQDLNSETPIKMGL